MRYWVGSSADWCRAGRRRIARSYPPKTGARESAGTDRAERRRKRRGGDGMEGHGRTSGVTALNLLPPIPTPPTTVRASEKKRIRGEPCVLL